MTCTRVVDQEVEEFEFQIYIPNGDYWDPDNELFDTYAITNEMTGQTYDFDRADEVVEHIQEITGDLSRPWHTN